MARNRNVVTSLCVSAFIFIPVMATGDGRLYAQPGPACSSSCTLMVPVVPFACAPAGCVVLDVPTPCPLVIALPEPCDPPTPVVRIRVRVAACGKPSEPIEYQFRVCNDSPADAHHVVVKNALPANATFVRASPEPSVKEPELEWRLGTLKGGGIHDITLVLQPTNAEDVRNCTRVVFEHGECVTTRLAALPAGQEPPDLIPKVTPKVTPEATPKKSTEEKTPVQPGAEAQLALSINGPKTQYLNVATRYFVTVKNNGKAPATNVLIDFVLANKAQFFRASEGGTHLEGKVSWLLGTLEPGASRDVVVELKSATVGELCHKATALADKGVKAEASICTTFSGVSALLLEMVDTEDPIPVGGATSYPIMIRNTGTAPVTNLRIKAVIPDALTLTRATAPVNHDLGQPIPGAKVLLFEPLATLAPGAQADYVIFVQGAKEGDARMHIEMTADQLEAGPVIEEESTRVYPAEEMAPQGLPAIRNQ